MDHSNKSVGENLDILANFISTILTATEETKKILRAECDEARFVLKPWNIETTVIKEIDKIVCNCDECITDEQKAEEIALEIDKKICQSQQLREKLASNIHREKRESRKISLCDIYGKPQKSQSSIENIHKLSQGLQKSLNKNVTGMAVREKRSRSISQKRGNEKSPRNDKTRSKSMTRSQLLRLNEPSRQEKKPPSEPTKVLSVKTQDVSNKQQFVPSTENTLAKRFSNNRGQKNFILANKLSLKKISAANAANKLATSEARKSALSMKDVDRIISSEKSSEESLESFDYIVEKIDEISMQSENKGTTNNCLLRKADMNNLIEQKIVTSVDVVEGLDRFGVPSDLLKSFRMYHSFLKYDSIEKDTKDPTKITPSQHFLDALNQLCEKRMRVYPDELKTLLLGYTSICSESSIDKSSDIPHQKNLIRKYQVLDTLYKKLDAFNGIYKSHKNCTSSDSLNIRELLNEQNVKSFGIWNNFHTNILKLAAGPVCIRYSDRSQLMQFYLTYQEIQRLLYEKDLIEILRAFIIPNLKNQTEPNNKIFIEIYRALFAITQIINPRLPVLVQTDENDEE